MTLKQKQAYMRLALALAEKGFGHTRPNPMVGCVIVNHGKIVGQGYHHKAGQAHAEINALRQAGSRARGGTLFVSLEPCCHWGKTPPCTNAVIAAGVREVVAAMRDPNPLVAGKGLAILRKHGIRTTVGVCTQEAQRLNEIFCHNMTADTPFVTLKIAQTLDGRIADARGRSQWITNEQSRRYVHALRGMHDAVLVGVGTVLADDPRLTARLLGAPQPYRVVLDSRLSIPINSHLVKQNGDGQTIVLTKAGTATAKRKQLERRGVRVWDVRAGRDGKPDMRAALKCLYRNNIKSVLIEGGQQVFSAALAAEVVHKVVVFCAPKLLGSGLGSLALTPMGIAEAIKLKDVRVRMFGEDVMIEGFLGETPRRRKEPSARTPSGE
jgi:diaminohydroxyphosphoribosylaminopyrimidine deaminase/5-amino-6-(5-phosphoribosylamino)uracil reductase